MEYVETDGSSIDDAIERALQRLGVTRDKVDIEILANATRGLFGFGGQRAKVRATLRRPLTAVPAPPNAATSAAPTRSPAPPADAPATAATDGAMLERARVLLAEIVRLAGSEARVETGSADGAHLVLRGDASGVLIGRRGQTLDALEYLVNRIVGREGDTPRLIIDAEGYRQRRREALEQMARRVADRVRERGRAITLNPMSPRDRRIVHLALQGDTDISTRSAGAGFYRKVIVARQTARATPRPLAAKPRG
jgi:spoIIIJ-associated protein